ncbi:trifunctional transcriptional regulator/proline dehydrogenase/L-glutamate gamma-semialdehyde dehydrogenase [Hydromonas duriensis]|uniref:Bifunctional protein PutA n=1 Tax=Hydromonas duriensis TaxID=1527608 RepID=A0A4R6Y8C1_9BURK|nr:trifunctional transcriptional regulator/proline dehydrogenase/L-glutamate gamma-semialdehyde dehydrogenase [Hydromonas duriensis]TDR31633.1 L-proline dehydrogenase /delta-1-pyrroline-5-carboxylate dehydrogenase [Hydromonas duriensis]
MTFSNPVEAVPFSNFVKDVLPAPIPLRAAITAAYRRDEQEAVNWLLGQIQRDATQQSQAEQLAKQLVSNVRSQRTRASGVDALMHEFSLSSDEGVALMCLAEALLRIPDSATADRLIADKISKGDWRKHLGESPSMFVNAATWGLVITGKLVHTSSEKGLSAALSKLIAKGGEPLIRKGVDVAMRMLGKQFVTGQTIKEAIDNSIENEKRGYQYSYDMLGEAALTMDDADKYYQAYEAAIHAIGKASNGRGIKNGPGISVKLSALHPRYSRAQRERVMTELLPRLKALLLMAKSYNIGLNIDAEETDRLELSLDLMEALAFDKDLSGFEGLGFVVQAYQKRCPFVIDFLVDLSKRSGMRFMVRLVKGAYWDAEIKRAQMDGMAGYPVYTRKVYTDVSYLACAQKLLAAADYIYPQFATHNAHSVATIYTWAQASQVSDYEFQCLHGMGETLYDQVVGADNLNKICRIYAPVGSHVTLLAYLVRRLLENGANSSFVNQIVDESISIDKLIADPVDTARALGATPNPAIVLPRHMFGNERLNSMGMDFSNENTLRELSAHFAANAHRQWQAEPILGDDTRSTGAAIQVVNPARHNDIVGQVVEATMDDVARALNIADAAASKWRKTIPEQRAVILQHAADALEKNAIEFIMLAVREAGKSLPNAVAEIREAVDFLRYYGVQVKDDAQHHQGLGAVVCISPWNFPLAIFIGEVAASLAAGNTVLAKPAEQTPLIAYRAVQLLHEAGVPHDVLQFLPGRGETVGSTLVNDSRVKGVIFTGSTEVANIIHRNLSTRTDNEGTDIALIAETGGQNALIMDSSALPEQVVTDVLVSAFDSAGQRCSALRVLCLQKDIAEKTLEMLHGALNELRVGSPDCLATDVGPVIDAEAQSHLLRYIEQMREKGHQVKKLPLPASCDNGTFVPPTVIEISRLSDLSREVFGPVLHVLSYERDELPQLIQDLNATGYGLTLGVHTRIDETQDYVSANAHVGNIYVNRNIVGAVVGVQPFGGEGKSGTGPKAGGPLYIRRLQGVTDVQAATLRGDDAKKLDSPLVHVLLDWASTHGHENLLQTVQSYVSHTLHGVKIELPGPTGERNTLSFTARGQVLCGAISVDVLLHQLAAVWATGNQVLMLEETMALLPKGLPASLKKAMIALKVEQLETAPIDMALLDVSTARELRQRLASRSSDTGGLVQIMTTDENKLIPLWRLVAERALCVNTTAAGGNASLMTMAG